jgi:hypothetical protein
MTQVKPTKSIRSKGIQMGLFATQDFDEGDYVTEYGGVLITEDDFKKNHSEYVIRSFDGSFWDAAVVSEPFREQGRWINDARGTDYEYNCAWEDDHEEEPPRPLFVVTTKPVKKGEEFFINYGNQYWETREDDPLKQGPSSVEMHIL